MFLSVRFYQLLIFIFYATCSLSLQPLEKQDYIDQFEKMSNVVEPFRHNLTECARQTKASMVDVENFLKRVPQSSIEGKCFVACMLRRNSIIKNNKIMGSHLLEINRAVYGDDGEILRRLKSAIVQCTDIVEHIFEICEYASVFNDCMHMKMEHILDKVTVERRMEALGQMTSDPEADWDADDDILQLVKDEL
ncbi:uncharacterized protein LOC121726376 [Aricia agestis]|uniref:uncharacterized protein LOC121726376 n=1 Tax=Aricia agestis TaxID=91739 RepID=UPI001C206751|nr:uncharacterized protein LOC121726376 [Aricia agestis]XP_041969653.1 uncharacterized protein LOC121726376 [Aricia agestis]XP_041969654.1 uncharacterized protein LOC121726376 [Aricia agestis]XP_041969655.1 uncharacterized protein LOC121726376 [Aricia agestis]XP_041969656.1 uncharacterized protein LOC121726376 [Aricia agestis]